MNVLSREQQITIIACLTEGQSIRATERLTGIHRDTIMRLGERVGRGCAELHDRIMVGIRTGRLELDEIWGYVGKKQKRVERHELAHKGDQYTFVALASSAKAIIAYRTGKRDSENTDLFVQDLRQRVSARTCLYFAPWQASKPSTVRRGLPISIATAAAMAQAVIVAVAIGI
ncbi:MULTISPECIES: hypothetical protein [unclassified Bradyrhizobium]|uniref:hypothetical protein n=1 Tax=unclassified Bradyrhizobium TaxID=2631580 RepID=UPI002915E245|nr:MULTISPECIES: hypothetical protein [unclassified Bradyrhizobium]